MIYINRYSDNNKEQWDSFVKVCKNGIFMFERDYMDYHRDRFPDHSLMFFDESELVAVLPMNEKGDFFQSHGGLTFGGFLTTEGMKQHTMNDCFEALIRYAKSAGKKAIVYKEIPHIYHLQPAEEDRYALYANGAKMISVDASTYINLSNPLKMAKGRKSQISRAVREKVEIKELFELSDFEKFIQMENEVLSEKHNTTAVHSGAELKMLRDFFPENIHLFCAFKGENILAGTVVYEYGTVVHTQYMATNEEARRIGALDLTIDYVIQRYKDKKKWLDFGISTEHGRIYLNEGLIHQKESFGGRTGIYNIWELTL